MVEEGLAREVNRPLGTYESLGSSCNYEHYEALFDSPDPLAVHRLIELKLDIRPERDLKFFWSNSPAIRPSLEELAQFQPFVAQIDSKTVTLFSKATQRHNTFHGASMARSGFPATSFVAKRRSAQKLSLGDLFDATPGRTHDVFARIQPQLRRQ
ncbi:hypothetical protein PCANC_08821 [Puccinia coronata f. sp. avenae]|uniref:Uncharacterized protein n=1 Tax=Puccinia coronata f. sp. avenae TaxID=200324 RepID=A0A2N5S6U4_9BASI|nr:hypothetical protein PCASD_25383 [Puccinia coronata f. sp. avenae]PLW25990.1 hypothetical protein PCANC_25872 [Puccinia coronata f. sp. avenae]PLW36015.1 hypothetical protein PCASD_13791 [Puccinia coronata f. sp. avenae]PLW46213.1 hypothetical protein PCANC_08821 [Puccinia coronata f. sp. avenae]